MKKIIDLEPTDEDADWIREVRDKALKEVDRIKQRTKQKIKRLKKLNHNLVKKMGKELKLFFTYYGGKWRIAKYYPKPLHNIIVEPFAGSAGYALHYYEKQVKLYDIDPIICSIWDYLIRAKSQEILNLPLNVFHVDEEHIIQEAKWLIGFWLNKGCSQPAKQPSLWMRQKINPNSFWGEAIRHRIAEQVDKIKHWTIEQKSYNQIDNEVATWFTDPPYFKSGCYYKYSVIDYTVLKTWCLERNGQIIVCEQEGATWLPFHVFRSIKTTEGAHGKSKGIELIWTN